MTVKCSKREVRQERWSKETKIKVQGVSPVRVWGQYGRVPKEGEQSVRPAECLFQSRFKKKRKKEPGVR